MQCYGLVIVYCIYSMKMALVFLFDGYFLTSRAAQHKAHFQQCPMKLGWVYELVLGVCKMVVVSFFRKGTYWKFSR